MTDGTLSVRRRNPKASEFATTSDPFSAASLKSGAFESFLGGTLPSIGKGRVSNKEIKSKPIGDEGEIKINTNRKKKLKEYDRLLKGFKYSAALDSVLSKVCSSVTFYNKEHNQAQNV
jgi:U3 small nucleolar RNA-associated protein 15